MIDDTDLEERIRQVLTYAAQQPVGRVELRHGLRTPIPRHRSRVVAISVSALVVLAATTLAYALSQRSPAKPSEVIETFPAATLPAVTAPSGGSQPVDFGFLRLWLPSSWSTWSADINFADGTCSLPLPLSPKLVPFVREVLSGPIPAKVLTCPVARHGDWIGVSLGAVSPPTSWRESVMHGVPVWTAPEQDGLLQQIDVPSLDATIVAVGAEAQSVAKSLGESSLYSVVQQSYPATVPANWKQIRYNGLSVKVPANWSVSPAGGGLNGCGRAFYSPGVLVGAAEGGPGSCANTSGLATFPGDGVWLYPAADIDTQFEDTEPMKPVTTDQASSEKLVYSPTADNPDTIYIVWSQRGRSVGAIVGLGTNPQIAEAIVSSFTVTSGPDTRISNQNTLPSVSPPTTARVQKRS
jgi:hypothetical protein